VKYLPHYVARNLLRFIEPLKEREDYALLLTWFDVKAEHLYWVILMICMWNKKQIDGGKPIVSRRKMIHAMRAILVGIKCNLCQRRWLLVMRSRG
jgi:hypothetical protein